MLAEDAAEIAEAAGDEDVIRHAQGLLPGAEAGPCYSWAERSVNADCARTPDGGSHFRLRQEPRLPGSHVERGNQKCAHTGRAAVAGHAIKQAICHSLSLKTRAAWLARHHSSLLIVARDLIDTDFTGEVGPRQLQFRIGVARLLAVILRWDGPWHTSGHASGRGAGLFTAVAIGGGQCFRRCRDLLADCLQVAVADNRDQLAHHLVSP